MPPNFAQYPMVSILMTTRNAGHFIQATLDSIIAQSYQNWELIAVNNQSTDLTLTILKGYAKKDNRIKVYTNPGLTEIIPGLQYAFSQSHGRFITRMDSDDLMPPNKLENLVTLLTEKGAGYLATGRIKHFSDQHVLDGFRRYDTWLNQLMVSSGHYREIYRECVIPSSCWMVHRQDFIKCGGFGRMVYPEDYDLCFRFYYQGMKITASSEILHLWREHPDRISRIDSRYKDQLYYDLKLYYFLKLDWDRNANLVLWGAGKKGKKLALKLRDHGVKFTWVCDNKKKIGHHIYNIPLHGPETLGQDVHWQILIAVSSREKEDISNFLRRKKIWYRWFC